MGSDDRAGRKPSAVAGRKDHGEEVRSVIVRAKHEADQILRKARALLREARSFQGTLSRSYESHWAEARRIGFTEGYRAGREKGQRSLESGSGESAGTGEDPGGPTSREGSHRDLEAAWARFEAEKQRYIEGIRRVADRAAAGEDIHDALAELLEQHPAPADVDPAETPADAGRPAPAGRKRRRSKKEEAADRLGVRASDR